MNQIHVSISNSHVFPEFSDFQPNRKKYTLMIINDNNDVNTVTISTVTINQF